MVLAEAALEGFDQAPAVPVLLGRHAVEDAGGGREPLAQHLGIAAIDPGVVLLGRDRQREDLAFAQVGEAAPVGQARDHGSGPLAATLAGRPARASRGRAGHRQPGRRARCSQAINNFRRPRN